MIFNKNPFFLSNFLDSTAQVVDSTIDVEKQTSNPAEHSHIDEAISCSSSLTPCSGVRRKSPTTKVNTETNVQSLDTLSTGSGTKKKIRSNPTTKSSPTRQDYYSIWTARESFDKNVDGSDLNENEKAPPLPPRQDQASHRPLERSWPPRISRVNKPQPQKPSPQSQPQQHQQQQRQSQAPNENVFQFDIIDIDDPVNGVNDVAPEFHENDFIPGEFFKGNSLGPRMNKEREECAPLATPETDGSSEINILKSGPSKTPENMILKPLLKKKIGPDNYISTILTQKVIAPNSPKNYSFPSTGGSAASATTNNHLVNNSENANATPCEIIPLKPHRPLTRQLSANNAQTSSFDSSNDSSKYATNHDENINRQQHFTLCRKPSLRSSPRQRNQMTPSSPPSGSSTRSVSPLDHIISSASPEGAASPLAQINKVSHHGRRRSLTRTGDTGGHMNSSNTNSNANSLICPPTPTHHARRFRSLSLSLGAPELRGSRDRLFGDSTLADLRQPLGHISDMRENGDRNDGSLAHITSTRLPSIPERARPVQTDEELPGSWEARMDSQGRIFYIDHMTRTTSWQRPHGNSSIFGGREQHRQQLERRYQSIRRTITNERNDMSQTNGSPRLDGSESNSDLHPAIKLLCRPDFYSKLHTNEEALTVYNRNAALKHMILRIRRDSNCFERYQYNKDLVALVNCFAIVERDLPGGWESKLDSSGKPFFIDHTNRRTSFMDPRLPVECPRIRHLQQPIEAPMPPPRPALMPRPPMSSPEIPIAYNDKVNKVQQKVNFLSYKFI